MDTREKIISAAEARIRLADGNWLVVAGYFDPVTAGVAERLHSLVQQERQERVLAAVLNGTEALLRVEDRSVMMAALRQVDAVVVMPQGELGGFLPRDPRIRFVFDETEERRNTEAFTAVVLSKEPIPVHTAEKGS